MINPDITIEVNTDESSKKTIFQILNITYLKLYEPFSLHIDLITGVLESVFERITKQKVICKIVNILEEEAIISIEILEESI